MAKNVFLPLLPASLCLLLAACGLQATPEQDSATMPPAAATPTRPFPADTLYSLLVAETAASRNQLDIALANYYQQAYKTRDPGVVRQATLLARHLNASQAVIDLAMLWADLEPDNPEPLYLAGQYLVAFQRLDQAMAQSRRLLAMDAQTLFVAIASSPGARDEATRNQLQQDYENLLQSYPDNIDLLLGRAILLEQQDDFEGSLASIARARNVDSEDLRSRLFEVDLLYKSGRPDKAVKAMADIVNDDPENDRLRLQYARMLVDQDLEKAREQFDLLARHNSMDPDLLLARALVNYRLKDNEQAKDQFEQLLFLKKHTDSAHYYLGEMALTADQPGKALEHYRRVEGGSEYLPAVIRSFSLMVQQDRRLEGQQWLSEQRRLHPALAVRLYLIEADTLLQYNDLPRSLAALDEAILKNPDHVELYYARSLLHEKLGNAAAAEADLRLVLARQPDNVDALNALGYVLADSNRQLDEAYRLINRALALRPEDPAIMDSMGWVLYRQGKLEESIMRLQQAFALYPNDEVAAHLGEVLWAAGKQQEAEKIWREGLKLKADSELIRATRARLLGTP